MPSPYNMIQQARSKQAKPEARRTEQWAAIQSQALPDQTPVSAPIPDPEPPQMGMAQQANRRANIDAIHRRHNQALKGAAFQPAAKKDE